MQHAPPFFLSGQQVSYGKRTLGRRRRRRRRRGGGGGGGGGG